jgi:hypothetical protein
VADTGDPLGARSRARPSVAVDGDDAVGDVGEDRVAALAVDGDRREELGVRERGRRVRRERVEASISSVRHVRGRRAYNERTPCTVPSGPTSGTPTYAE